MVGQLNVGLMQKIQRKTLCLHQVKSKCTCHQVELGVRVDSAMYSGYNIPPFYDSMVAKLITYADTREEAIAKMKRALT